MSTFILAFEVRLLSSTYKGSKLCYYPSFHFLFFYHLFSHCRTLIPYHRRAHTPHECWCFKLYPVKPPLGVFSFMNIGRSVWLTRCAVGKSSGKEWSWDSGRRNKAAYGEQVVGPWHTDTNKWFMNFGIVLLDVGKALFLWLEEELVQLGLSKLWAMLVSYLKHGKAPVYPLCVCETNECQRTWIATEFRSENLQNSNVCLSSSCVSCVNLLRSLLRGERERSKDN